MLETFKHRGIPTTWNANSLYGDSENITSKPWWKVNKEARTNDHTHPGSMTAGQEIAMTQLNAHTGLHRKTDRAVSRQVKHCTATHRNHGERTQACTSRTHHHWLELCHCFERSCRSQAWRNYDNSTLQRKNKKQCHNPVWHCLSSRVLFSWMHNDTIYAHAYTHTHVHTYTHTYTHTRTHTYRPEQSSGSPVQVMFAWHTLTLSPLFSAYPCKHS